MWLKSRAKMNEINKKNVKTNGNPGRRAPRSRVRGRAVPTRGRMRGHMRAYRARPAPTRGGPRAQRGDYRGVAPL